MSIPIPSAPWLRWAGVLALCLLLLSCAAPPQQEGVIEGTWAGRPLGSPPAPNARIKRAMISRATREWEFFGRQTVVFEGTKESIPNVGAWEDDDAKFSGRVNLYWRTVDKPGLYGVDCRQPWSAAFMGYIMSQAGVPESQFIRTQAHWVYLASIIEHAPDAGRFFIPRRVRDYSPEPGDLICAYREGKEPPSFQGYASAAGLRDTPAHCDLVVEKNGSTLEAIGGNVRNSVSRVSLTLDGQGHLQAVPRRPWFLILENRL